MDAATIGLVAFAAVLVLLALRVPIAFALAAVAALATFFVFATRTGDFMPERALRPTVSMVFSNAFDLIHSYSLSMIPDWRAALACAYDQTAPGGQLAVVDFGTQTDLPGWFGAGLRRWLGLFHVTPRADLADAMRALANDRGAEADAGPILRDYAVAGRIYRPA